MGANQILNLFFNALEWSYSQKRPEDIFWLYVGCLSDSMPFNIAEYVLTRKGLIK